MIDRLRRTIGRSRNAALRGVFVLLFAQLVGVVHMGDIAAHADGSTCQICQAIGHASPLPPPVGVPAPPTVFTVIERVMEPFAAPRRAIYSFHAPRGPPISI